MISITIIADGEIGHYVCFRDYHNIEVQFYTEEENIVKIVEELEEMHRKTLTTEEFLNYFQKEYKIGKMIIVEEKIKRR